MIKLISLIKILIKINYLLHSLCELLTTQMIKKLLLFIYFRFEQTLSQDKVAKNGSSTVSLTLRREGLFSIKVT